MRSCLMLLGILVIMGARTSARADSWSCYGGPNHSAVIADAAVTPDPNQATVLWKAPMLGRGFSGPAVVDGQVFILDRRGKGDTGEDVLRVLDLGTGKELWSFSYPAPGDTDEDKTGLPARCGPVSVPTVSADHIWFSGVRGRLYCLDRPTHALLWTREIPTTLNWKVHSPSPLLVDGLIVVSYTSTEAGDIVEAFRATDGEPVWRTACDYRAPRGPGAAVGGVHASPILATIGGEQQIVVTHRQATFGVAPQTGKVLWQYEGYQRGTIQAEAAISPDGYLFLSSGHDGGSALAQVMKADDGSFPVREVYHDAVRGQARACSEWRTGVWWDGHLYHVSNHFAQHGLLCMDRQGTVRWATKPQGARPIGPLFGQSCLTVVNGIGLVMNGGTLYFVRLNPEEYTELGHIEVFTAADMPNPGDNKTWAKQAYVDGLFLTRNHGFLACVQVAAKRP